MKQAQKAVEDYSNIKLEKRRVSCSFRGYVVVAKINYNLAHGVDVYVV